MDFGPVWNGAEVIYIAEQRLFEIHSRPADGRRPSERLVGSEVDNFPMSVSSDGRTLLYEARGPGNTAIWTRSLIGEANPRRVDAPPTVMTPDLAPDGRWLAYSSSESGRQEVYIASFPDPTQHRIQVSREGGHHPLWTRGGRELVFRRGGGFFAVTVDPATGDAGRPELLFEGPYVSNWNMRTYDVTGDGERFVVVKRTQDPRSVRIVTSFFEELRRISAP
jgi:serine/threonine-protein kinase